MKLSIEDGTWFRGRNMHEAVIWDGWRDDCSCLIFGTNAHPLAKLGQPLFVIGYIQFSS